MRKLMVLAALAVSITAPVWAQDSAPTKPPPQPTQSTSGDVKTPPPGSYRIPGTEPNVPLTPDTSPVAAMPLSPTQTDVSPAQQLTPPIHDDRLYNFTLFDLLEYRPRGSDSDVRWDIESWRGRDYRRFVFKTEGERSTIGNDYNADLQFLASRLTKPYTELQYGLRVQARQFNGANVVRPEAVIGLEARVPYNYGIETALYLDPKGKLSGDFTATKDILITQRLVLQGRLEGAAGVQEVERFGFGSGLRSLETGLRLRYEIKREFAPYIGISYGKNFGGTANIIQRNGGETSQVRFVAGVRAWF